MILNKIAKIVLGAGLLVCSLLLLPTTAGGTDRPEENWGGGFLPAGQYYSILDPPAGEILTETGRQVYVEDQYLTEQNGLYQVIEVDEDRRIAKTKFVEKVELEVVPP